MTLTYKDVLNAHDIVYDLFYGKMYGSQSYFGGHICGVAAKVSANGSQNASEYFLQIIVAYLHDALEDTEYTYEQMCQDFGQEVADIVLCLTRQEDETYNEYIKRVKQNSVAAVIKRADAQVNLEKCVADKDYKRAKRYLDALIVLSE